MPPAMTRFLSTSSLSLPRVNIPGGSFPLGITFTEHQLKFASWEPIWTPTIPVKQFSVSDFQMSRFEITLQQWKDVYDWAITKGYNFDNVGNMDKASSDDIRHPVNNITWNYAIKWCNAASEKVRRKLFQKGLGISLENCGFLEANLPT